MSAPKTPAEVLREAARLMRQRAEAATQGTCWEALDGGDRLVAWQVGSHGFDDDMEYVIDEPISNTANAVHIASWHPAVAIEVAKLLDAEATWAQDRPPTPEGYGYPEDSKCLRIARAYLGGANP